MPNSIVILKVTSRGCKNGLNHFRVSLMMPKTEFNLFLFSLKPNYFRNLIYLLSLVLTLGFHFLFVHQEKNKE
jgi:hypothetical protein